MVSNSILDGVEPPPAYKKPACKKIRPSIRTTLSDEQLYRTTPKQIAPQFFLAVKTFFDASIAYQLIAA